MMGFATKEKFPNGLAMEWCRFFANRVGNVYWRAQVMDDDGLVFDAEDHEPTPDYPEIVALIESSTDKVKAAAREKMDLINKIKPTKPKDLPPVVTKKRAAKAIAGKPAGVAKKD